MRVTRRDEIVDVIIGLCKEGYVSPSAIAKVLDLSVHTVRAHYVYPLVKEGKLVAKYPPPRRCNQAYKAV